MIMRHLRVRLYWVAVGSNVLALGILLFGVLGASEGREQVLAVMLTTISMASWLAYFRTLNR